jgi:hypothetical protein
MKVRASKPFQAINNIYKAKAVPLRATKALEGREGIVPTHSRLQHYIYSGLWLIVSPVNWGSRLFWANPGEQKQIENITRICFAYFGHHAF